MGRRIDYKLEIYKRSDGIGWIAWLNKIGNDGWRLVHVFLAGDEKHCTFYR